MQNGMANPNNVGAGAHHYMHILGIVALGSMWLMMAEAATKALAEGRGNKAFLEAKRVTARYFAERFLPDAGSLRRTTIGRAPVWTPVNNAPLVSRLLRDKQNKH